jgi:hypothetical protein
MCKGFSMLLLLVCVSCLFPHKAFAQGGGLVIDTPIVASESTKLNLSILVHGIGRSGDSVNPTGSSFSNKDPLHPSRPLVLQILNDSLQVICTLEGTMEYRNTGVFVSTITLPTGISAGKYQLKVRTTGSLWQVISVDQTLLVGQENDLPEASLVVGDSTDDARLDVRDYNLLMQCFATDLKNPTNACDEKKKIAADLTDDGLVNQSDYNLFLREFVTHPSGT